MIATNQSLKGYSLKERLFYTDETITYRAIREKDQKEFFLKTVHEEKFKKEEYAALNREFSTLENMNISGIQKAIEIFKENDRPAMVMEFFDGVPLSNYLLENKLSLADFLLIAIKMGVTLSEIHGKNIMHKDINPNHVLYNKINGEIKLTGFSNSTNLNLEYAAAHNPNDLKGTLHYISPEQTGRMNRSTDHRTDLYSMGITFYKMLMGKVPFESDDPLEIVHAHLAKSIAPLTDSKTDVPEVLSDIILKLTEKAAEDRYQSATGLVEDLKKCLTFLQKDSSIPRFPIAEQDVFSRFHIPEKLYGRKKEIMELMEAYETTDNGKCKLLFVNGYSGVGKTALVNEIHKPTMRRKGYFISGKFDQFKTNIPFHAFALAFSELAKYLLSEPENQLIRIKKNLIDALGANTAVLTELVPEFELILGKQEAIQQLNPLETQNRFFFTLFEFIKIFAKKRHPLSIFIDDLQWCDDSSLKLIKELVVREIPYLFIIGSYRDNEVSEVHPLAMMIEVLQKIQAIQEIHLEPLQELHVNQMIADTLMSSVDETKDLAHIIFKRTAGNPFFVYELLKNIHHDGHIQFDHADGIWKWDLDKISKTNASGQVIDLMTKRIKHLDASTIELLQIAACIGNTFELKVLSLLTKKTAAETSSQLWQAIQEEIIIPVNADYLLVTENEDFGVTYRFQHDRVQQAAYNLIDPEKRKKLHLKIGHTLLESLSEGEKEDKIVELLQHLNEARSLITKEKEKEELAALNLKAGAKAGAAVAYEAAVNYYKIGIDLLPEDSWETHYQETFDLYTGFAQNAYQTLDFDAAENAIELLYSKAKTKLQQVDVISIRLRQNMTIGKSEEAIQLGIKGLALLGFKLPEKPGKLIVLKEVLLAKWNLGKKRPMELLDNPILKDPEKLAAARLLTEIMPSAYVLGNINLFGLSVLKVVNLSLKYGNSPQSAYGYVSFGAVLADAFGDYKTSEELGQLALALNEKFNSIEYRCRIIAAYGVLTHHHNHHWSTFGDWYKKGVAAGYASGDLFFLAHCANNVINLCPDKEIVEIIKEMEAYVKVTVQTGYQDALDSANINLQQYKNLIGKTKNRYSLEDDSYSEETALEGMIERKYSSGVGFFHLAKADILSTYENYEEAFTSIQKADKEVESMLGLVSLTRLCFVSFFTCSGLIYLNNEQKENKFSSRMLKKRMKKELARMTKWAKYNPTNYIHWQYLMEAEQANHSNQNTLAAQLYEKAIFATVANNWLPYEALANELAAKFYLRTDVGTAAAAYLKNAYEGYEKWGATEKLEFLKEKYADIIRDNNIGIKDGGITSALIKKENFEQLDVSTLFKSHQAISGEIELKALLEKMMWITMMNAGAENGTLLLQKDGKLFIQAFAIKEDITTMQNTYLEDSPHLPISLINYVSRSQKAVVLDEATAQGQFTEDPYIQESRTKSILCNPIVLLNKLYGVIYLENNISVGAFTEERLNTLSLLSSQMAISIQNAQLYAELENKVEERTLQLSEEIEKSDELLHNILPEAVADELKANGEAEARQFGNTTVLFTDFVNFTNISERLTPKELVKELNFYFTAFDDIVARNDLEKIKTIGDAYLAVSGMPNEDEQHAAKAVRVALEINTFVEERKTEGGLFDIRIGLNSGAVVAGIVGVKKFAYDIWGDTVNTASRMESNCPTGKINISDSTFQLIKNKFDCTHRGQIEAKNKGMVDMYFVEKER